MNERLEALVLDPIAPPDPTGELVLGVDGIDESLDAADWTRTLGSVAHAVYARRHGRAGEGSTPEGLEALVGEARNAFAMVDQDLPDSVRQHVFDNSPSEALSSVSEAVNADAIVLGPHLGESVKTSGLGAQAQQLIHAAPRPVLVAKEQARRDPVLVALGDDPSSQPAAWWAVHAATEMSVPLVAVHSAPEDLKRWTSTSSRPRASTRRHGCWMTIRGRRSWPRSRRSIPVWSWSVTGGTTRRRVARP